MLHIESQPPFPVFAFSPSSFSYGVVTLGRPKVSRVLSGFDSFDFIADTARALASRTIAVTYDPGHAGLTSGG